MRHFEIQNLITFLNISSIDTVSRLQTYQSPWAPGTHTIFDQKYTANNQ